jgi:hypothetical protein
MPCYRAGAPQRRRDLALALIVARLLAPAAKLATARMLDPATASHSLGEVLGLGKVAAGEVLNLIFKGGAATAAPSLAQKAGVIPASGDSQMW